MSQLEQDQVGEIINELLDSEIIQESNFPIIRLEIRIRSDTNRGRVKKVTEFITTFGQLD